MGIQIIKTVNYLPDNLVTNDDLAKFVDTNDEWISQRTGIKTRFWADDETLVQMIKKCVRKFSSDDVYGVDVILVTSMSNCNLAPNLSSQVASIIEVENCLCLDINAACSGYVYGLLTAIGYLNSKLFNKVLLISSEKMTNILNMNDRNTNILFGDGVSASIIKNTEEDNILDYHVKTLPGTKELFVNSDNHLQMLGQDVFKFAYKAIIDCLESASQRVKIRDIDYFIFHQANIRIINKVIKKYNLEEEKVLINIDRVANTSSASIPLLLGENMIPNNKLVFICGFGAGLSYGSILYKESK